MKLSRETHRQLESFFREYFGDDGFKLPQVEFFIKRGAGLFTKIFNIYGITLGRRIFIKPDLLCRNPDQRLCISKELLAHEMTHVVQYQKLGWIRFLYTYLKGYWEALKVKEKWDLNSRQEAYLEIPHEVEARECAAEFLEWLKKAENDKFRSENREKS